ncbi:MAG: acyl-CoA thioesterase [Pseudomonadota bacterium]
MNLVLRLLLIMFTAFRAPKFGIWGTGRLDFTVWSSDSRAGGTILPARHFSYADLGVLDYTVRSGILKALRANGWSPFVISKEMKYAEPLRKGDRITFTTRLIGWRGHYSCLYHEIFRDGDLVAEGHTIGRFVAPPKKPHPTVDLVATKTGFDGAVSPQLPDRILDAFDRLETERQARRSARTLQPK